MQKSNKKQTRTIEQTKKRRREKAKPRNRKRESEDRLLLYTILNRGMPGLCKRNKRRKKLFLVRMKQNTVRPHQRWGSATGVREKKMGTKSRLNRFFK